MCDSLAAIARLLRGLPLLFRSAPRTPLRVLCIIALDTLHVLRHSQPLSRERISELAMLLDFQACTNAVWDRKNFCEVEYRAIRQRLENAGLGLCIEEYLTRLRELETRRPPIGGDHRRFDEVRSYREAVARLSLATVVAVALDAECHDEEIGATHCDNDVEALFRIVMQCQIIDDVVDYAEDQSAGLPSFLTACASLPQAIELTARAARYYGASCASSSANGVFPIRVALRVFTAVTTLVVRIAHRRYRSRRPQAGEAASSAGRRRTRRTGRGPMPRMHDGRRVCIALHGQHEPLPAARIETYSQER
jgi:hypothetical protein